MANLTNLVFEFADANAQSIFFVFPYGDDDADVIKIKNAMNAFIANGSIFKKPPVAIKSAKAVTSYDWEFDLSD